MHIFITANRDPTTVQRHEDFINKSGKTDFRHLELALKIASLKLGRLDNYRINLVGGLGNPIEPLLGHRAEFFGLGLQVIHRKLNDRQWRLYLVQQKSNYFFKLKTAVFLL